MDNPWRTYVANRYAARQGEKVFDGPKVMLAFPKEINDRIEVLAELWGIPRADMVRWLAMKQLEAAEKMTLQLEVWKEED